MKSVSFLWLCVAFMACTDRSNQPASKTPSLKSALNQKQPASAETYTETKQRIDRARKALAKRYLHANPQQRAALRPEITAAWIQGIGNDLYQHWQGTPWDFNGVTTEPGKGNIACGYYVTSMLQDMGVRLNRRKLSTCTSMQMMKELTPGQKVQNLSTKDHRRFCQAVARIPQGVYIIGLDFHTGLLVHDEAGVWFVHSNYINNEGVIREAVEDSGALQASSTKWVVSLTGDDGFVTRWLTDGA